MAGRYQCHCVPDRSKRAPTVKAWGRAVDERQLFQSVLTLAEFDKGIANLRGDDPDIPRHIATRDSLEARFAGRILPLGDRIVRRWGEISGRVKRETGHPPPVIDTLLAATAIEAQLYLVSRNTKDLRFSGATLFDPWRDTISALPLTAPQRK